MPATDEEHEQAKHLPYQELVGCLVWNLGTSKMWVEKCITMEVELLVAMRMEHAFVSTLPLSRLVIPPEKLSGKDYQVLGKWVSLVVKTNLIRQLLGA